MAKEKFCGHVLHYLDGVLFRCSEDFQGREFALFVIIQLFVFFSFFLFFLSEGYCSAIGLHRKIRPQFTNISLSYHAVYSVFNEVEQLYYVSKFSLQFEVERFVNLAWQTNKNGTMKAIETAFRMSSYEYKLG